jgi:thioredoxin 1
MKETRCVGNSVDLTDANFSKIVQESSLTMIDFWTVNCQPCRAIAPWMEEFSQKYVGKVLVGKIRADANPKAVGYFNITTAPTILIIRDGREVHRITLETIDKSRPKEDIEEEIINTLNDSSRSR